MQIKEAVSLINHKTSSSNKQIWVDLGAGSGTFTLALSFIIPVDSIIYAVDKNKSDLEKIPAENNNSTIEKIIGDFTKIELPYNLDGILMANSLHYVKDKSSFIRSCEKFIKKNGFFLIVEYDTRIPNPWIPYPVNFKSLKELFEKEGYNFIKKIGERSSIYRNAKIYSALICK